MALHFQLNWSLNVGERMITLNSSFVSCVLFCLWPIFLFWSFLFFILIFLSLILWFLSFSWLRCWYGTKLVWLMHSQLMRMWISHNIWGGKRIRPTNRQLGSYNLGDFLWRDHLQWGLYQMLNYWTIRTHEKIATPSKSSTTGWPCTFTDRR